MKTKHAEWKQTIQLLLVFAVMFIMALLANILSPGFLEPEHLYTVLRQMAFLGIVSIGQTLVILSGGIDLSLSYTLVLCNVVSAQIISGSDGNLWTALLATLGISVLVGLVNGLGVIYLRIPAMIMTLAVGSVLWGAAYIYCNGAPKGRASPLLKEIINGQICTIFSWATLLWLAVLAIMVIVLRHTAFGRTVYAIGSNRAAAAYSGLRVKGVTVSIFVIASLLAGLVGMLLLGYTGSSYLSTGKTYNMDSIAAVVIGGISIEGGKGSCVGTVAGVGIMTIMTSVLTVLNIAESGKLIAQGIVLIFVLVAIYGRAHKNSVGREETT